MPLTPTRGVPAFRFDPAVLKATSHVRAAARQESILRQRYLSLDGWTQTAPDHIASVDLLAKSAAVLELLWVGACLAETEKHLGLSDHQVSAAPQFVLEQVRDVCHLDVAAVLKNAYQQLKDEMVPLEDSAPTPDLTMPGLIRLVRATLEACPISALLAMAGRAGAPDIGHRCRVAIDGLQAFLFRVDPKQQGKVMTVGRLYATGRLEIEQVATLMEVEVQDAIVLLEQAGFHRPVNVLRLSDADRRAILERIHADRQHPVARDVAALARRDAIASSRIEDIDARQYQ